MVGFSFVKDGIKVTKKLKKFGYLKFFLCYFVTSKKVSRKCVDSEKIFEYQKTTEKYERYEKRLKVSNVAPFGGRFDDCQLRTGCLRLVEKCHYESSQEV